MIGSTRRYLIDERDIEPEVSLAQYRTIFAWASTLSDRFVLTLQHSVYDDPADVTRLCALGRVKTAPEPGISRDMVQVEGSPDEGFVLELTSRVAPRRAISGDVCPVEDVTLLIGERILYGSYDYGRDQILDLTDEEVESLRKTLKESGLDPARVITAPPPIM